MLNCIATCRPIAKSQLCKQATVRQPLLGNSSVDTLSTTEHAIMENNNSSTVACVSVAEIT
jgi:hypothetical protein